ncbi:hypothetical protein JOL62DRAFT_556540 [Phyllosticta paracitricarpa]|uniref:Uncharacterized protein n=1 Tax=Phyllosticta paracitricarpa TaxID=2016321 RepID=A0ABR1N795_9PEZI
MPRITINLYSFYFNITYYTIYSIIRYLLLIRRDSYYIVERAVLVTIALIIIYTTISIGDILLYKVIYISIIDYKEVIVLRRKGGYKVLESYYITVLARYRGNTLVLVYLI